MLRLFKKEIDNQYAQENFVRVEDYLNAEPLLKSQFKFFEMSLSSPSYPATVAYKHDLGFLPKDALVTSAKGSGSFALEYAQFSPTHIYLTITGPVSLRMFLGTYAEGRTA